MSLVNYSENYILRLWNDSKKWFFKNNSHIYDKEVLDYLSIHLFFKAEISIYKAIWKNYNIKVLYQDTDLIVLNMQNKIIAMNIISHININNHKSTTISKNIRNYKTEINIKGYNNEKIKELYIQIDNTVKKTIISCITQIQRAWRQYNILIKINKSSFIQKKIHEHTLKKNIKKDLSSPLNKCSQNLDDWISHHHNTEEK